MTPNALGERRAALTKQSSAELVAGLEITGSPHSQATAAFSHRPQAGKLNALICTATPPRGSHRCSPHSLAEYLGSENLPAWRDLIVVAASPGQPQHIDPALTWLMAHAALEVAVAATRTGLFYAVDELQMLGEVSDTNLAAAICARIRGQTNADQLLTRLQARLQGIWEGRFNNRLRQYAELTAGARLATRGLWPRHDGMPIGDGWAHQAAATLWPERYMAMLTAFPSLFQSGFAEPLEPLDVDRLEILCAVWQNWE